MVIGKIAYKKPQDSHRRSGGVGTVLKNILKRESSRRKKEEDIKVKRVTIQVTEREKEIIQALAEEEGSTVSDYIRRMTIYRQLDKFVS